MTKGKFQKDDKHTIQAAIKGGKASHGGGFAKRPDVQKLAWEKSLRIRRANKILRDMNRRDFEDAEKSDRQIQDQV